MENTLNLNLTEIELLGKADCPLNTCLHILEGEYSTVEKKEALSSIGRKRDQKYKPILFKYAAHGNPEVALQAIRGLVVFKKDKDVKSFLHTLREHQNDMIKDVVQIELSTRNSTSDKNHTKFPNYLKNIVVEGDVLKILKHVPDESIHLTFTSPPYYNARDYSIYASYAFYLSFLEDVCKEVHRITKEGRFFILNTSPIIIPRAGRKYSSRRYPVPFDIHARLVKLGWEFIDDIVWAKPENSAKNRISNFNTNRKPLTYKPNPRSEYLMVYRKKTHRLLDWNLKQYDRLTIVDSLVDDHYERSNVWNIAPTSNKNHTAVFPIELCNQVIKLYSFKNDLVFDPFAGSGTMGLSAINLNRNFFLTEIKNEFVNAIINKISQNGGYPQIIRKYSFESFKGVAAKDA